MTFKDPERNKAYQKEYYQRPSVIARKREYNKTPKARAWRNQYVKEWALKHKERWNLIVYRSTQKKKNILFGILGAKCVKCGFSDKRALQFDHINGGGNAERRKGSRGLYFKYANRPEEAKKTLQVLCANCNWIKRYEKGEFGGRHLKSNPSH